MIVEKKPVKTVREELEAIMNTLGVLYPCHLNRWKIVWINDGKFLISNYPGQFVEFENNG